MWQRAKHFGRPFFVAEICSLARTRATCRASMAFEPLFVNRTFVIRRTLMQLFGCVSTGSFSCEEVLMIAAIATGQLHVAG
ncbi:MAG: hypothetical protein M3R24_15480 [Chloroflexota bacterium]|nr:hypothetical protein [Chloroflexota bacterium]